MKQYVIFIITAVILFSSVFVSANLELKSEEMALSQEVKTSKEEEYFLKDKEGRIAVYRECKNYSYPMLITETLVNTLPKEDQIKLKEGISVKGDTALRKALEDYCS